MKSGIVFLMRNGKNCKLNIAGRYINRIWRLYNEKRDNKRDKGAEEDSMKRLTSAAVKDGGTHGCAMMRFLSKNFKSVGGCRYDGTKVGRIIIVSVCVDG